MPDFYAKGTLKVKNADGIPEPFYPKTDMSLVSNGNSTLSTTISNLNTRISDAANKGGIKVMYEEPTAENTADFGNKTLIGWIEPDYWKYTISVTGSMNTSKTTTIPFYFDSTSNTVLNVNWGDDTNSTITKNNYNTEKTHTYDNADEYIITISSSDWSNVYYCSDIDDRFKYTFKSTTTPFPQLKGTYYNNTKYNNNFYYTFHGITYRNSCNYPSNLFINNTQITSFEHTFRQQPNIVFTEIPTDLFRYNTAVTSFSWCFYSCSSLRLIPQDLFRYNTSVTDFSACFSSCTNLGDFTIHIGSPNVTNANSFVTNKSGTTRIVYVPQGSTTQTTFNNVASSLGLTIIGE